MSCVKIQDHYILLCKIYVVVQVFVPSHIAHCSMRILTPLMSKDLGFECLFEFMHEIWTSLTTNMMYSTLENDTNIMGDERGIYIF